jgi:methylated-DNA-[protein]-cysteine S-methyltransferase
MIHTHIHTPLDPVLAVGDDDGRLAGLWFDRPAPAGSRRDDEAFAALRDQIGAYFAGEPVAFDVPLALAGTPWQREVWQALQAIPYGETMSYGELAARLGRPSAARAVGAANGRNPVSVIVPCHRLIGASGALTGYLGGIERKRWLIDHERSSAALTGAVSK